MEQTANELLEIFKSVCSRSWDAETTKSRLDQYVRLMHINTFDFYLREQIKDEINMSKEGFMDGAEPNFSVDEILTHLQNWKEQNSTHPY